jgi:CDP-glycerol glycerophosphotransferase
MNNIKKIIKKNQWIYQSIFYIYAAVIHFLSWILSKITKIEDNTIVFNSFYSRSFNDSPKALFDKIIEDPFFENFTFIWIFSEPENFTFDDNRVKLVKLNSLKHLNALLKSRIWITNSDINSFHSTGISSKKHYYVNTWHGIPLKKIGLDEPMINWRIAHWYKATKFDLLCTNSDYDSNIFGHVFPASASNIIECGLPRNDELINSISYSETAQIKKDLNIFDGKKVVLYAPTYRDYHRINENETVENVELFDDLNSETIDKVKENYVFLIRAHYLSNVVLDKRLKDNIIDVSKYPNINNLMKISDILITDYSSVFFDFSLLEKPIYLLTTDLEKYYHMRGTYLKIEDLGLPYFQNSKKLFDSIINEPYDLNKVMNLKKRFFKNVNGSSTQILIDKIKQYQNKII